MSLTTSETAELASLQAALLKARTGGMPTKIIYNGQETDYAAVDLSDLRSRVNDLLAKEAQPDSCRPFRTRGRIRFRVS